MLTLGSKYQINPLQEEATRLLRECFPEQLEDYVTPHTSAYLHMFINHDHYPGLPKSYSSKSAVKLEHWDCVAVVNLARKFDLDFVLPAAFYACAQMHTEDLFRAVRCSDGKAHKLSQADLHRVVDGRAQLCIFTVQSYRWLINGPPSTCLRTKDCKQAMGLDLLDLWGSLANYPDVLLDNDRFRGELRYMMYCEVCLRAGRDYHETIRKRVWEELTDTFDIPTL